MSQSPTITRRARLDRVCADAVDVARRAAEETGDGIGEHLEVVAESERVVTHYFDCALPGYRGWRWAVVVVRAPRARNVTVSESVLLPGPDALTAPQWVPWSQRLRAGDVGVGDLLLTDDEDDRLEAAYVMSDDDAVEDIAFELGVGRERVMTREGRAECAQRWYDGDSGPRAEISVTAPSDARCGTCGFYLPLAGSLRLIFGVCGNVYASDDAKVVSADHGCGAHSEVLNRGDDQPLRAERSDTIYDDGMIERVSTGSQDTDELEYDETPDEVDESTDAMAGISAVDEDSDDASIASVDDRDDAATTTIEDADPSSGERDSTNAPTTSPKSEISIELMDPPTREEMVAASGAVSDNSTETVPSVEQSNAAESSNGDDDGSATES